MMARQHVTFAVGLTGVGLATAAYLSSDVEAWVRNEWPEALLFLLLVAGGALVPDMDHPKSTLVKKLGWLGAVLNWLLRLFGIKHRGFLHSFVFAVISGLTFLAFGLIAAAAQYFALFVIVLLLFYASVTFNFIFGRTGRNPALILALAGAMGYGLHTEFITLDWQWLAAGAFLGPVMHDFGDMCTHGRLAFWYPFSKKKYGSPVTFRTGSWLETGPLRVIFFVWSLATIVWVGAMGAGALERTDFAALGNSESAALAVPYIAWSLNP